MPEQPQPLAPEYRYYTADLLSNQVLTEIPFRGVSYSKGLNGAGSFSGSIPVIKDTEHLNVVENTTPTQTALYAVRNGKCVWGGIIWSRDYDVIDQELTVSASEFPSYFHHRRIWKTWIHDVGATVSYTDRWNVEFDYGTSIQVNPGSTVHLDFDEDENKKYNGHYRVSASPAPTRHGFKIEQGFAVADIATAERKNGIVTIYTAENHGYSDGETVRITISDPAFSSLSGDRKIAVVGMNETNVLSFEMAGANIASAPVSGTTLKTLPQGTYENVTVSVRSDAFDYVRSLVDATAADYVGTEFPNEYIEPGISTAFNVVQKRAALGAAVLETEDPHGLAVGQAVQLRNVDTALEGEWVVQNVSTPNEFAIYTDASIANQAVAPKVAKITKFSSTNGVTTFTTASAHNFRVGERVVIDAGPMYPTLSGTFKVQYALSATTFAVSTLSTTAIEETVLTDALITVGGTPFIIDEAGIAGNVVTLVTRESPTFSVGDTAIVTNTNREVKIVEKSLDAVHDTATIMTDGPHGYRVGQQVKITGLYDSFLATEKTTTTSTTTLRTNMPHAFRAGDQVTVSGVDEYQVTKKAVSANVVTLTAEGHNIQPGTSINVLDVPDVHDISRVEIMDEVATLTVSPNPNFQVNDTIEVTGLIDSYAVETKAVVDGMIVLTTNIPHNVLEGSVITVSGMGAPYDGEHTVSSFTSTRVYYKVDQKWADTNAPGARKGSTGFLDINIPDSNASGLIVVQDGYLNGEYLVKSVVGDKISYQRVGNNYPPTLMVGKVSGPSAINGTYTVTAATANTLSYSKVAPNMPEVTVPAPANDTIPVPAISVTSVHSGVRTISSVTSNTVTFAQTNTAASFHGNVSLTISRPSIFNGTHTITALPDDTRFDFTLTGFNYAVTESDSKTPGYVSATNIYNGTYTITYVNPVTHEVAYAKVYPSIQRHGIQSTGAASVTPAAIVSTFGPFPGNADIGIEYESRDFAGINLDPLAYRGFELKTVGDALDAYSDNINGFEYRIDSVFDAETETFRRILKLLPITLPNPPKPGEVSPLSRFGADKLVFEYPAGSIQKLEWSESGEDSATRFFASGTTDLGPDAGPPIGIASSNGLLRGDRGRKFPLLDATESMGEIEEETTLHNHARRYLSESEPPISDIKLSVNGSIPPYVGTYSPGDWCSIIVDDRFIQARLKSGLEPRDDVIVRKITAMSVKVPDGTTAPEEVSLTLTPEWEVDVRAQ